MATGKNRKIQEKMVNNFSRGRKKRKSKEERRSDKALQGIIKIRSGGKSINHREIRSVMSKDK